MQDKKRTYSQLDHAIKEIFFRLSNSANSLYSRILLEFWFEITEDDSVDPEWVRGKMQANKSKIIKRCNFAEKTFYRTAWAELEKAGLIKEENGYIILPKFKSKGVSENGASKEYESRLDRIEQSIQKLTDMMTSNALGQGVGASVTPHSEAPPAQEEKAEGDPVMTPTGLAKYFLELAGHKPTSKALADAEAGISEMLIEHDYKEIAFGIKWIFENSPEKPKTIKYIVNGMSRAMGAYEKQQAKQKNEAEKANQEKIEREKYDELAEKLDEYIDGLEPEQYMEYAERATAELKEQGVKEGFITDLMISIRVKSIIAREVFNSQNE
jgi:hypothetical protein